jgi:hypothetical protein
MPQYCLIRIHDGRQLMRLFESTFSAERHADHLSTITGQDYTVYRFIGARRIRQEIDVAYK